MDHVIEFGVQGFRTSVTLFPDWAVYVLGQFRENGYDQRQALSVLKQRYVQILANPEHYGVTAYEIRQESTLAEVRRFDLKMLPLVETGFLNEMMDVLLSLCVVQDGRRHYITVHDAQVQLLNSFPHDFHTEIKSCIKSVYAALSYHPGARQFFVSPIKEVDAYNPFAPHHFTDDDKAILYWTQSLLYKLESIDEYTALDYSFKGHSEQFRAWIDYLLDGSLDFEAGFRLTVADKDGHDNYCLSVTVNTGTFEFNLYAHGKDSCNERYSETVLYWFASEDGLENDDAKEVDLEEYSYWFTNMLQGMKIDISMYGIDMDEFDASNRPQQLKITLIDDKDDE